MMPLLNKLLFSGKSLKHRADNFVPLNIAIEANDRNSLTFGTDQVRILLFRECEWRGRKLLFDSIAVEKICAKSSYNILKNGTDQKRDIHAEIVDGFIYEHEKVARDDVSLLSEMVFGTVAMTYRGPSFKIHGIDSPPCIMCTKVFPAPDNTCKQSEKRSDETLGHSVNIDSNSSSGSIWTPLSRPSSGTSSGNRLSPDLRKNSTCSSTGSGWDIDVPLPRSSSQSLENSSSSGVGSLTSLRRRWFRAVSTSLSRSESDDIFGIQYSGDSTSDNHDNHVRRHKTRLGLAMMVQLTRGCEKRMEARLLEHVALLEGMLDRLRCSCFESSKNHGQSKGKSLVARMHRASARCTIRLLRLLMDPSNLPTPLLWHRVLLNSTFSTEERMNVLYHNLHQMCRLLDDVDTKSTNFFLSTVVTAVLTYHLGWVHTVLSSKDRRMVDTLAQRYPCNPLWVQLGDLYGALGNPLRLVHTVIAGDTDKTDLINTVLTFLTYFIRSGIIEKRHERRSSSQQEVQEAIVLLEQLKKKQSSPFKHEGSVGIFSEQDILPFRRETNSLVVPPKTSKRRLDLVNGGANTSLCMVSQTKDTDQEISKLKRSSTKQNNLNTYTKSEINAHLKGEAYYDDQSVKCLSLKNDEKDCNSSTVKIIVSEITPQEFGVEKECLQRNSALTNFERKLDLRDSDELPMEVKIASLQRYTNNNFDLQKLYPDGLDEADCLLLGTDLANESKQSQVLFTLGNEEKPIKSLVRPQVNCNCQCSFAFTRVPSTSAELPEGVLRKIIQRNFPESSKNIQPPSESTSSRERSMGFCLKCNGNGNGLRCNGYAVSQSYEGSKLLLETPTNATEVLRTCGNSVSNHGTRINRSNSLEALMEANGVVELPMPRSKKVTSGKKEINEEAGFSNTLLHGKVNNTNGNTDIGDTGYTWGLVVQGLTKKKKKREKMEKDSDDNEEKRDWWWSIREEIGIETQFPMIDQPISEALCILADLDTWQVGILTNNISLQSPLLPVGMSRLVSNMLEAFAYVWKKYRSPVHCVAVLESKLREMWLRSETLAEMLMAADLCDASITTLSSTLDLDAADIPLLLAVATTHSPQIAQRFGLALV